MAHFKKLSFGSGGNLKTSKMNNHDFIEEIYKLAEIQFGSLSKYIGRSRFSFNYVIM